jgi:hypothetical protein
MEMYSVHISVLRLWPLNTGNNIKTNLFRILGRIKMVYYRIRCENLRKALFCLVKKIIQMR